MTTQKLEPYLKKFVVVESDGEKYSGLAERFLTKNSKDDTLEVVMSKAKGTALLSTPVYIPIAKISKISLQ
jgi:hypothetical protein